MTEALLLYSVTIGHTTLDLLTRASRKYVGRKNVRVPEKRLSGDFCKVALDQDRDESKSRCVVSRIESDR